MQSSFSTLTYYAATKLVNIFLCYHFDTELNRILLTITFKVKSAIVEAMKRNARKISNMIVVTLKPTPDNHRKTRKDVL